jgi:hypothetical protein
MVVLQQIAVRASGPGVGVEAFLVEEQDAGSEEQYDGDARSDAEAGDH